jgi:hypothetical protein
MSLLHPSLRTAFTSHYELNRRKVHGEFERPRHCHHLQHGQFCNYMRMQLNILAKCVCKRAHDLDWVIR